MKEQTLKFDTTGHDKYYALMKDKGQNGALPFGEEGLKRMEHFAGLMQKEMNGGLLTGEMVDRAYQQAGYQPDSVMAVEAMRILCTVWRYGDQLIPQAVKRSQGLIDPDRITVIRSLTNNAAFSFIQQYPDAGQLDISTPKGQEQEDSRILSTVLPTPKLIDLFEKHTDKSRTNMSGLLLWCPILNFRTFRRSAFAGDKNAWRGDLHRVCEGAKARLNERFVSKMKRKVTEV